jgi:hypothetical protein
VGISPNFFDGSAVRVIFNSPNLWGGGKDTIAPLFQTQKGVGVLNPADWFGNPYSDADIVAAYMTIFDPVHGLKAAVDASLVENLKIVACDNFRDSSGVRMLTAVTLSGVVGGKSLSTIISYVTYQGSVPAGWTQQLVPSSTGGGVGAGAGVGMRLQTATSVQSPKTFPGN